MRIQDLEVDCQHFFWTLFIRTACTQQESYNLVNIWYPHIIVPVDIVKTVQVPVL